MTTTSSLDSLTRDERLQLLRFVVSFAWADLSVGLAERAFVQRLVAYLRLDAGELQEVERWLSVPPEPDSVDPASVPPEHRRLFLDAVRRLTEADGELTSDEKINLALFEQLTR